MKNFEDLLIKLNDSEFPENLPDELASDWRKREKKFGLRIHSWREVYNLLKEGKRYVKSTN